MVCRECGAYNAEHLTHCRVCAAKLRDDAAPAAGGEGSDRPARDFVAAPSWPKGAFTGAPENPPLKAAEAAPQPAPAPQPSPRPIVQQASEPATRRACPHCGKATLADAPYCAYCGELLNGPAKAAAPAAMPARPAAAAPVKKPASRPAPVDDYDDEYDDEFDDEDEDDFKPAKRSKRAAKADYDDEDFDGEDDEDYDDEDYDDEDFDELPKKRGKGTTILFWGLIVLLIAVICICGKVIADRNFDGDISKMFASIGSIFGGEEQPPAEEGDAPATDTTSTAAMYTATVTPFTDETGNRWYDVNVIAPTGSTVQVISNAALDTSEAVVPQYDNVILRVAEAVFLPSAPCESEIVTVTPNIQVITADGQTVPITVDPIAITVPVLSLTLESPAQSTVQATFANDPVVITGIVDDPSTDADHTVEVFINDEKVLVENGGRFTYNYTPTIAPTVAQAPATPAATTTDPAAEATTPPDGAATTPADGIGETVNTAGDTTGDTTVSPEEAASDDTTAAAATAPTGAASSAGEVITIEARKNNCVTAKTTITVEPYVFQNISLLVSNDPATGLSTEDGSITLQGSVTPGATLAVASDSDKLSFGEPTVSATGNFTVAVTVGAVGAYNVTLTATQEGYNESKTSTTVERRPAADVTYKKFKTGATDLSKIISKVTSGETKSGDVYFTGTVTEIIGTTPYTIFKVKLSDDTEVVCVNRSAKSKINSGDVKEKKQLFGSLSGFYNDSTTPYIWVWFMLNK